VTVDKINGQMRLRAMIQDHKRDVIATKSLTKLKNFKPVAVEALGALHAAKFCRDLSLRKIISEDDELKIVNTLNSNKQN
jgi:hypothetical protein